MKKTVNSQNIIEQDELRRLEALCTAEEPPACTSACPLHVDAREFCRLVAEGDFAGAFKLYQKSVPFARIVARTCNAPCRHACLRAERGGAVELQLLEKFVAGEAGRPQKPPLLMQKKSGRAAIIGGGLRGMAAADSLARKGYGVTIFERNEALGGWLRELPDEVLPSDILREEIEALVKLGVRVEYRADIALDTASVAENILTAGFDAAFIACSGGTDDFDAQTLQVEGREAVFAGRRSGRPNSERSAIYDVYDGRSAALSIDRLFQKVSLMAGREGEGAGETRLFVSLAEVETAPPVSPAGMEGYTREEAMREAARCIQCRCMECVKKCGFLQHYKGSPRRYLREVYNNLSIAMGARTGNHMINTCALCGQCEAVCPNGLELPQVFLAARRRMVQTKKMPPSAHEFALLDMEYSMSESFFEARHQPGHSSSEYLFFPGCQLAASEPELVRAVYADLCGRMEGGVGLMLSCCGIMAHWAGEEEALSRAHEKIAAAWNGLGRPRLITACPTCTATLGGMAGLPAQNLAEILHELGGFPTGAEEMVLHHACGARYDADAQNGVRALAVAVGVRLPEAGEEDSKAPCCGYGGLVPYNDNAVADRITETALTQLGDGAPVLTYCVNCRDRYLAHGRDARHLLELCYPETQGLRKKAPTWSERQKNRADLKRSLLSELWGENIEQEPEMKLYIDPEVERKLEESCILHSDIARVIEHAEETGEKFVDPESGRTTAGFRPENVTFWVEYSPEGGGWRVHNAYSHRMTFILTDRISSGEEAGNG